MADDTKGLWGLVGSVAKALGKAFVDGLEAQAIKQIRDDLGSSDIRTRKETGDRLRTALERPEFPIRAEDAERIEAGIKVALASAETTPLIEALQESIHGAGWQGLQRLLFLQFVAPNQNLNLEVGTGSAPSPSGKAAELQPHLRLVPEPEAAEGEGDVGEDEPPA